MNFIESYKLKIENIDNYIHQYLKKYHTAAPVITDAMSYSVLNGGKRLRSILCTEICRMLGGSFEDSIPFAAAIELIHAYSLVHDDLPAMDNADTRRGQPSCHKKFGEDIGILCGDALLNSAYELILSNVDTKNKLTAGLCIADAAGALGMVNGQVLDLESGSVKNADEKIITDIVLQKTMALIKASVLSGAYIAGCNTKELEDMSEFSYHLGLAFQIRDDFEDMHEDESTQSDCPNFITALGEEVAAERLKMHSEMSMKILSDYDKNGFLVSLHKYLFK